MPNKSDQFLVLHINEDYEITTSFRGEVISWDGAGYRKTKFSIDSFDMFAEINDFLKTQPIAIHVHLFESYKRIYKVLMQTNLSVDEQANQLIRLFREFTSVFDFEAMDFYVRSTSLISIPSGFAKDYIDPSTQRITSFSFEASERDEEVKQIVQASTKEKTYLLQDYIDLLSMTVYFRLFNPIWGSYIAQTKDEISSHFKEYYAGLLLMGSKNVIESPGYDKLFHYLASHVEKSERRQNSVLDGLSSEDFPRWVLNLVLLRRITIGDVRGQRPVSSGVVVNTHLVTYIHSYVYQRILKSPDSFLHDKIINKESPRQSQGDSDDRKMSIFEAVRVSEDFSPGDLKELSLYYSEMDRIIQVICPDLPMKLARQALEAAQRLRSAEIHDVQIQIVQWMIGPYQPPSSLWNLNMVQLLIPIAVCQAVLWHRGYFDLAAIITATPLPPSDVMMAHVTRSNIPMAMIEEANELYPHYRRVNARSLRTKQQADIIDVVKSVTSALLESEWQHNLHAEWKLPQTSTSAARPKEYRIPADIRIQLMGLALRIGRYRFPFHKDPI